MKASRLPLVLLAVLLLSGCGQTADPSPAVSDGGDEQISSVIVFAMDTVMELTAYGENGKEALRQASARISQLEALLSTTDENSEVYAANHSGGTAVALSDESAALLAQALELCGSTGGTLDVSIYPVVRTWGFTTGEYQVPSAETLTSLLEYVDYTRIVLEDSTLIVPDGMEIDLGAVAKGYAGDQVMESFRQCGLTSALITLGGNVQTLGVKPDGSLWRIAIQDPTGEGYAGVLELENQAAITSGGYERYFEEDGVIYWHIIDPATGWPAKNGLVSVTIVSESGTLGDALSTALFVMGKERAIDYWRTRDDFDFVLIDEDGTVTISDGIEEHFSLYGDWSSHGLEVIRR